MYFTLPNPLSLRIALACASVFALDENYFTLFSRNVALACISLIVLRFFGNASLKWKLRMPGLVRLLHHTHTLLFSQFITSSSYLNLFLCLSASLDLLSLTFKFCTEEISALYETWIVLLWNFTDAIIWIVLSYGQNTYSRSLKLQSSCLFFDE